MHHVTPPQPDGVPFTEDWPKQKWQTAQHLSQPFKSVEEKGRDAPVQMSHDTLKDQIQEGHSNSSSCLHATMWVSYRDLPSRKNPLLRQCLQKICLRFGMATLPGQPQPVVLGPATPTRHGPPYMPLGLAKTSSDLRCSLGLLWPVLFPAPYFHSHEYLPLPNKPCTLHLSIHCEEEPMDTLSDHRSPLYAHPSPVPSVVLSPLELMKPRKMVHGRQCKGWSLSVEGQIF